MQSFDPSFDRGSARSRMMQILATSAVVAVQIQAVALLAAAVPQFPQSTPPAASGQHFMQQPRWRSTSGPSVVPATVRSVSAHIAYALARDPRTVPWGFDTVDFGLDAATVSAVAFTAAQGHAIVPWRAAVTAAFDAVSEALLPVSERICRECAPPWLVDRASQPLMFFPHVALVHVCTVALGLSDAELCVDLALGAQVVGAIPSSGNWLQSPRAAIMLTSRLYRRLWRSWLHWHISSTAPRDPAHEGACREEMRSAVDKGFACGPFSYDECEQRFAADWWPARIFPVAQASGVRACIHALESGHNDATSLEEALRCISPDWPARVAAAFAHFLGWDGAEWHMTVSTDDMVKAYWTFPSAEPQFTVSAIRSANGGAEYYAWFGFGFGFISAVNQFNRAPAWSTRVAQRIFAAPTAHYFDDLPTAEPEFARGTAKAAIWQVHRCLCLPLAAAKSVPPLGEPPRRSGVFLGVLSDFTALWATGVVYLSVPSERRQRVVGHILSALAAGSLAAGAAAKLAGKLVFVTGWAWGRFGRAAMQPLFARAASKRSSASMSEPLRRALLFLAGLVAVVPPREVRLRGTRRRAYVWTDACWEPGSKRKAGIGIVIFLVEERRWLYAECDCPDSVLARFVLRRQYIGQLELLAAVAAYFTFPDILADREVLHAIDNTSAIAALIKGYSRAVDSVRIIHAFYAFNLGLSTSAWFEYVATDANIADLPSRGDFELLESLGAERRPCRLPPLDAWDIPSGEWLRRATSARQVSGSSDMATIKRDRALAGLRPPSGRRSSVPDGEAPLRSRRRKYARALAAGDDIAAQAAAARAPAPLPAVFLGPPPAGVSQVAHVNITRHGPFPALANPFRMGLLGRGERWRRTVVDLHRRWLDSGGAATDVVLDDGGTASAACRPPASMAHLTCQDCDEALAQVAESALRQGATAVYLECSPACSRGRLCHGELLACRLRGELAARAV